MEITSPKTGDLVFFRDKLTWNPMTWLAKLIQWIAGITHNHVGVVVVEDNGQTYIYEAVKEGIVVRPLWLRIHNRDIMIRRPKKESSWVKHRAKNAVGTKYDFAGLLWFQLLYAIFGRWFGYKGDKAGSRFYCYEFAAYVHDYPNWQMVKPKEFINSSDFYTIDYY
jgi:hypothetical protein